MVLILDGLDSEMGACARKAQSLLLGLSETYEHREQSKIRFFCSEKTYCPPHDACEKCFELPSNISTKIEYIYNFTLFENYGSSWQI